MKIKDDFYHLTDSIEDEQLLNSYYQLNQKINNDQNGHLRNDLSEEEKKDLLAANKDSFDSNNLLTQNPQSKTKYRHIFFDLDHTIWDFDKNAEETLYELYDIYRLSEIGLPSAALFIETYTRNNHRLWAEYHNGKISKDELRDKLAELYKTPKDQVSCFGFRTQYGGGKSTGFALVYDSAEAIKKFEPHYRLVRYGQASKIEKASRQQRMSHIYSVAINGGDGAQ